MTTLWTAWVVSAALLLLVGVIAGQQVKGTPLGILIDERGRFSLNRFQMLWWLWIILSMSAAVTLARFTVPNAQPLGFTIPGPVLALLGTTAATTVSSATVKAQRSHARPHAIAASVPIEAPRPGAAFLGQIVLQEEGAGADQIIDAGKFQSFMITLFLGAGYVLAAVYDFLGRGVPLIATPADISQLPELDATFVALMAISSASYVGTKMIGRDGDAPFSVADRDQLVSDVLADHRSTGADVNGRTMRTLLRRRAAKNSPATNGGPTPRTQHDDNANR
ncbi:MAG: hypothetical protein QM695_09610 [Micropruina sp.]